PDCHSTHPDRNPPILGRKDYAFVSSQEAPSDHATFVDLHRYQHVSGKRLNLTFKRMDWPQQRKDRAAVPDLQFAQRHFTWHFDQRSNRFAWAFGWQAVGNRSAPAKVPNELLQAVPAGNVPNKSFATVG